MSEDAPGGLDLVIALVNTLDLESGIERLDSTEAAQRWSADHDLSGLGPLPDEELERLRAFREDLRLLLLAQHDDDVDATSTAWDRIDRWAAHAPVLLRFPAPGEPRVEPAAPGADAVVGHVLAAVRTALEAGTFHRLKVCPADDCLWAFYDRSRNRSRTWCSMEICGNRSKVAAYRTRARGGASSS